MAIPINMNGLIRRRVVESTRIEYKADRNPETIIHSIMVFANDFDNLVAEWQTFDSIVNPRW